MANGFTKHRLLTRWLIVIGVMLLFLIVLNPNEDRYHAWLAREYGISLEEYNYIDGETFGKDGQKMYESGTAFSALFFTIRDMKYYAIDDNNVQLEIKTVGVLNTFFVTES